MRLTKLPKIKHIPFFKGDMVSYTGYTESIPVENPLYEWRENVQFRAGMKFFGDIMRGRSSMEFYCCDQDGHKYIIRPARLAELLSQVGKSVKISAGGYFESNWMIEKVGMNYGLVSIGL